MQVLRGVEGASQETSQEARNDWAFSGRECDRSRLRHPLCFNPNPIPTRQYSLHSDTLLAVTLVLSLSLPPSLPGLDSDEELTDPEEVAAQCRKTEKRVRKPGSYSVTATARSRMVRRAMNLSRMDTDTREYVQKVLPEQRKAHRKRNKERQKVLEMWAVYERKQAEQVLKNSQKAGGGSYPVRGPIQHREGIAPGGKVISLPPIRKSRSVSTLSMRGSKSLPRSLRSPTGQLGPVDHGPLSP